MVDWKNWKTGLKVGLVYGLMTTIFSLSLIIGQWLQSSQGTVILVCNGTCSQIYSFLLVSFWMPPAFIALSIIAPFYRNINPDDPFIITFIILTSVALGTLFGLIVAWGSDKKQIDTTAIEQVQKTRDDKADKKQSISRKIIVGTVVLVIVVVGVGIATDWFQFILSPHTSVKTPYGKVIVPAVLPEGSGNFTLVPGKTILVISAQEALQKLQKGDLPGQDSFPVCGCDFGNPYCNCDLTVTSIALSYKKEGLFDLHQSLDPVWVFAGTLTDGFDWHWDVYAWKFANFTEVPAAKPTQLTVQFNDTSQDFPNQWLWDFGDGSNSTLQNVTHRYASPGIYNVTLNAGNPRGNDSITKKISVGDTPGELLNPNATTPAGSAEAGNTP